MLIRLKVNIVLAYDSDVSYRSKDVVESINILKRFGAVLANVPFGRHISRVYYLWIILYAALILIFALADRKKRSESK